MDEYRSTLENSTFNFFEHDALIRLIVLLEAEDSKSFSMKHSLNLAFSQVLSTGRIDPTDLATSLLHPSYGLLTLFPEFTTRFLRLLEKETILITLIRFKEETHITTSLEACLQGGLLEYKDLRSFDRMLFESRPKETKLASSDLRPGTTMENNERFQLIITFSHLAHIPPPSSLFPSKVTERILHRLLVEDHYLQFRECIGPETVYLSLDLSEKLGKKISRAPAVALPHLAYLTALLNPFFLTEKVSLFLSIVRNLLNPQCSGGDTSELRRSLYHTVLPAFVDSNVDQIEISENLLFSSKIHELYCLAESSRELRGKIYQILTNYPPVSHEVGQIMSVKGTPSPFRLGLLGRNLPYTFRCLLQWNTLFESDPQRLNLVKNYVTSLYGKCHNHGILNEVLYNLLESLLMEELSMDGYAGGTPSPEHRPLVLEMPFKFMFENNFMDWNSLCGLSARVIRSHRLSQTSPETLAPTLSNLSRAFILLCSLCAGSDRRAHELSGDFMSLFLGPIGYLSISTSLSRPHVARRTALRYLLGCDNDFYFELCLESALLYAQFFDPLSRLRRSLYSGLSREKKMEEEEELLRSLLHGLLKLTCGLSSREIEGSMETVSPRAEPFCLLTCIPEIDPEAELRPIENLRILQGENRKRRILATSLSPPP